MGVNARRWLVTVYNTTPEESAENPTALDVLGFPGWALLLGAFLLGSMLWRKTVSAAISVGHRSYPGQWHRLAKHFFDPGLTVYEVYNGANAGI